MGRLSMSETLRTRRVQVAPVTLGITTMPKIKKTAAVQTIIESMVKRIVKKFHPEQIILLGSQVRGDAGPESDIDLLVVMPVETFVTETRLEISLALPDFPVAVDIIVTTPENFAWRKDIVGTIEWPATREGKVLYSRLL